MGTLYGLVHLVTWFHADTAEFSSTYAQALGDSTSRGHYRLYERCVRVFFASARRWNPEARLMLVTNVDTDTVFDAVTTAVLERLGVERLVTPNRHRTPPGYHDRWQNQFYVLDVIDAVLEGAAEGPLLVCDSDCVVTGALPEDLLGPAGIAALPMPLRPDEPENGLSALDLADLAEDLVGHRPADSRYLGGELIAMEPAVLRQVRQRAERAFERSLERRARGLSAVNEEAHLLSVAIASLGLPWREARFARRLWTQPWKFRTVRPDDVGALVWHLPAEKKTGLARLDAAALREDGWFWRAPHRAWVQRAGAVVGVPGYRATKGVRDLGMLAWARLRRSRGRG